MKKNTMSFFYRVFRPGSFDPLSLARLDEAMTALRELTGLVVIDEVQRRPELFPSNELGPAGEGGLIDRLIAAGHGTKNLSQILQLLADQPGTGIPADFVTSVGNNPAGSEVFTAPLSNFAGLNSPVGISADGTLIIVNIFGRDYDGDVGFVTNNATITGDARVSYTLASNSSYFIDTGVSIDFGPITGQNYMAIGIAHANASRSCVISNEAPGYLIDKLMIIR